jgi:hypothetical protein
MTSAVIRFVAMLAIFAVWLSWLGYLAFTARQMIVLSRPQLLISNLDVIAWVDRADATEVKVEEVHWPASEGKWKGQSLAVQNLSECSGWAGPGSYILLLTADGKNWRVTPTPRSPGYPVAGKPRIYPATQETLGQLKEYQKPEAAAPK